MATNTLLQNQTIPGTLSSTIASGTTTSEIELKGVTIVGLRVPASMSSTSITFTCSDVTGGTFSPLRDYQKNTFTVTIDSTAGHIYLDPTIFASVRFIKIVCGSSETAKTLQLVVRPV